MIRLRGIVFVLSRVFLTYFFAFAAISIANAAQTDLVGPAGSGLFGGSVTVLPNGNIVVVDTGYDLSGPTVSNVGAVHLYDGTTLALISTLTGGTASDIVGSGGITVLTNGNYVVSSSSWGSTDFGAVTWCSATTGCSGVVSSSNSLVGSTANDVVGSGGVTALTNGNYVVSSINWDNPSPAIAGVGAVTWGNGTTGTVGLVSASNSLIGGTANDTVGAGVTALTNGNYVVRSPSWDNASPVIVGVGAVTWGNGAGGTVGLVSASNSLVGSTANDTVGNNGVTALTGGNYVVNSSIWGSSDFGAVTWGNGTTGTVGLVSASNSLVGSTSNDGVGNIGVTALTNGNYVVISKDWGSSNVGAVTWGNGTTGISGVVSSSNSLVGSTSNDGVGNIGVTALTNGNYVVISSIWGSSDFGAVTWGNGTTGISGTVSSSNSLVGSTAFDTVGYGGVTALTNGNYVVNSSIWGSSSFGAVTWGNGTTGVSGTVSSSNSLVGGATNDRVGTGGVTALTNGNFVVNSSGWDKPSPTVGDASAYTFGNGASGTSGLITNGATGGNSVVGTVTNGTNTFAFDATRNRLFVGRSASNIVSVLSFTTTATTDGDLSNAANWNNGVPNGLLTGIIPSGRTMSISSIMNIGQLQVQCGGNLTGGSASAYIVGSVRRDFCAAAGASFTYPIGDPGNYSPLNVANVNGTGNLTASVTDTFMPGLQATTKTLSRYWSLEGAGITANLTFNYVNADVNGTEADYKVFRRPLNSNALITQHSLTSVNAAANTVTAFNVSSFSDWGVSAQPLAPTAAGVSISGRVLTPNGNGLRNAIVQLTDLQGITRTVRTSSFGYYHFDEIEAGQTVVLSVVSKRFTFSQQVINVTDNASDVDFVAF